MSNKRTALLKMKDDLKKSIQVPFKVRKEIKKLESWMLDKEETIATLEADIEEAKGKEDLNIDSILDKVDDLAIARRRFKQGEELMEELFKAPYEQPEEE